MGFLEVEFPRNIGYHRLGSPSGFSTTVNQALSGMEQRNQNWANSRGKWTVSLKTPASVERQDYVEALISFHLVAAGKANAFRLWDHLDNSLAGQAIGVADGEKTVFQLIKTYTIGGRSYIRNVTKPVMHQVTGYQGYPLTDTVTIALSGTPAPSGWTLDYRTGLVTFSPAPASGKVITTPTGSFHYPVRFDADELPIEVEESAVAGAGAIVSIHGLELLEVLPPNY